VTKPLARRLFIEAEYPAWLVKGRGRRYECPEPKPTDCGECMAAHACMMASYGAAGRITTHMRPAPAVDALGRRMVINRITSLQRARGGHKTGTVARRRVKHRLPGF